MALTATIYKAELTVSDMDRDYYCLLYTSDAADE